MLFTERTHVPSLTHRYQLQQLKNVSFIDTGRLVMETAAPSTKSNRTRPKTKVSLALISLNIVCLLCLLYKCWKIESENHRLRMINAIYHAEHRILKGDLQAYAEKPTYDEGVKDTLIRLNGPQIANSYYDGWQDALKIAGDGSYSDGYHAAIQQFGYQKPPHLAKWLAPEPENKLTENTDKSEDIVPTKVENK